MGFFYQDKLYKWVLYRQFILINLLLLESDILFMLLMPFVTNWHHLDDKSYKW